MSRPLKFRACDKVTEQIVPSIIKSNTTKERRMNNMEPQTAQEVDAQVTKKIHALINVKEELRDLTATLESRLQDVMVAAEEPDTVMEPKVAEGLCPLANALQEEIIDLSSIAARLTRINSQIKL